MGLPNGSAVFEGNLMSTDQKAYVLVTGVVETKSACDEIATGYDTTSLKMGVVGGCETVSLTLLSDPCPELFAVSVGERTQKSFQLRSWALKNGRIEPATKFGAKVAFAVFGPEQSRW
jgi:hypothetical protein